MSTETEVTRSNSVSPDLKYAPVKKRIHTDMTSIIVGNARKVLFAERKQRQNDIEEQLSPSKRRATDAEELDELIDISPHNHDLKVLRLQVASLFFDTIPSFSQTQLASAKKLRKQCSFRMKMTKDCYLSLFRQFGKVNDLSELAIPPDDVFDYYCQCIRHRDGKERNISKDILLVRWDHLPKEEQQKYESQLDIVKKNYNIQFKEWEAKKKAGTLPLYEERIISDLKSFESFLGPMSLKRTFAGYRTISGQIPVVVAVSSPIHLVFDEVDKTLEFRFSVSPVTNLYFLC